MTQDARNTFRDALDNWLFRNDDSPAAKGGVPPPGATLLLDEAVRLHEAEVSALRKRLAAEIAACRDSCRPENERLNAEVSRLTARVDELLAYNNAEVERRREAEKERGQFLRDRDHFVAEHDRLRDALNSIAYEPQGPAEASHEYVLHAVTATARAALSPSAATPAPETSRHAVNDVGECTPWCEACRFNRWRGLNPDGTPKPAPRPEANLNEQ